MKRGIVSLLVTGAVMVVIVGCAKRDVVKKDEPVAASAQVSSPVKRDAVQTEQVASQPIAQAKAKEGDAADVLKPIPNAGELQPVLDSIYFAFDSYVLGPDARATISKNAGLLKSDPGVSVRVEGHCDERGSSEYNLALGERRAKAAMQYLLTMGIPEKQLSIISYGKEKPIALGHDEGSWAKNRRDEFRIVTK